MNLGKTNDLVVQIKTPTLCFSNGVILGDRTCQLISPSHQLKSPGGQDSSKSVSYSDSFDCDSPIKAANKRNAKCYDKLNSKKCATFYRKCKINVCGKSRFLKPSETTKRLMEANQIKINELLSENADCNRKLLEATNELKTLQNENKIQERYLKKITNRDADVPNIISRYNSEVHSLKELLRRNKEKLTSSIKDKGNLEIELNKARIKIEKLTLICNNKNLEGKDDLLKKTQTLNDLLEVGSKKEKEIERSVKFMTKKHSHQLNVEAKKYKELNNAYKATLNELRDTRNLLKEKVKLLEMQNIYTKVANKPPHHLMNVISEISDNNEHRLPTGINKCVPSSTTSLQKESKKQIKKLVYKKPVKLQPPSDIKISTKPTKTMIDSEEKPLKNNEKRLFYGDTPSETSEVEEKSEKTMKFSDLHEEVLKNMQNLNYEDGDKVKKMELLAKLKEIDANKETCSPMKTDIMKEEEFQHNYYKNNEIDVFCTSESDQENVDIKGNDSMPCLFFPQGSFGLMGSRRNVENKKGNNVSNFDFLGFPLNNNNCYSLRRESLQFMESCDESSESISDCEEINID